MSADLTDADLRRVHDAQPADMLGRLCAEVLRLRAAIRTHRDERGDERNRVDEELQGVL